MQLPSQGGRKCYRLQNQRCLESMAYDESASYYCCHEDRVRLTYEFRPRLACHGRRQRTRTTNLHVMVVKTKPGHSDTHFDADCHLIYCLRSVTRRVILQTGDARR
jgi:hypothetical protein